jgi:hypothetical protein
VPSGTRSPYAPGVSRRSALAVALLIALTASGCDSGDGPAGDLRPTWHEVSLPLPPGPAGRIAVRDAASCAGSWYVVGAVLGADGASRPAAWTSTDARTWRSVPTDPAEYYAKRAILYSVACRDGRVAAIGAKSGGAHGNPRTSSWYQRADGTLVDLRAAFVLYGGAEAVSVDRIAAGPEGWLIAGNRRSGAAVWSSSDATDFGLIDDDPQLSTDADHETAALDPVHDGTGWTVVGRAQVPHRASPVPLAWTSSDGLRWRRQEVPAGTDGFADLERVVALGDRLVAVGIRGTRFGSWTRTDGTWNADKAFGRLSAGTGAPFVSGLAVTTNDGILAAASDGSRFHLWARSGGDWRGVRTPTEPATTGDAQLTVVARDDTVLLLADNGTSGRMWRADWNTLSR